MASRGEFIFDTNIEAVVRRVRAGISDLSRAVAQQSGTGAVGSDASAQLERRLSTAIQRANRELQATRREFEQSLTAGAGGGVEGRPTQRAFRGEAEAILRQLRNNLISDLRQLGRQFDLPDAQVREAILGGTAQLTAGFKELFLLTNARLREVAREQGVVGESARGLLGGSGLGVAKSLPRDVGFSDKEFEARVRALRDSVRATPQDIVSGGVAAAQREARKTLAESVQAIKASPQDARSAAVELNNALKAAVTLYATRIKEINAAAAGTGANAASAGPGARALLEQVGRVRSGLGLRGQTLPGGEIFGSLDDVARQQLTHFAAELKRSELALLRQAQASRDAAAADTEEARASRTAAVEASKARAGLTDRQVRAGRLDDERAIKGAELERRLAASDPFVSYGRTRGEVVEITPGGPEVFQLSRRALGAGSLLDPEGRRHTLATRLQEDAEDNALKEYLEKFRATTQRELDARNRIAAAVEAKLEREFGQQARQELRSEIGRQQARRPQDFRQQDGFLVDTRDQRVFRATRDRAEDVTGARAQQVLARALEAEAAERAKARAAKAAQAAKEAAAQEKLTAAIEAEARQAALAARVLGQAQAGVLQRVNRAGAPTTAESAFLVDPTGRTGSVFRQRGQRIESVRGTPEGEEVLQRAREVRENEARGERSRLVQALREEREATERVARLQRELAAGISERISANRFLTPRGLEDRRGRGVIDPIVEADARRDQQARILDQQVAARLATGQARSLGGGLVLDQALGRFVQVANGKAQILQGALTATQITQLNSAVDRLRREADQASKRVAQAQAGAGAGPGGGGGRRGFFGTIQGGFSEGFNSAGFAGGSGGRGLVENLSRTAGLEARFALTYRALLLVQSAATETVREFLALSEAERNLEIALGDGDRISQQLRSSLTEVASIAGESVSVAMNVAARGVRAFVDVTSESQAEVDAFAASFAETAERLSVIAQQSLEESANESVAIGQSFGLRNNLGQIAEVVAEARRLGGDPDEISSGLAQIGVAAEDAGLDVRESAAIISAAIAQTGQSGQAVATRLSRVFNTLRGSTGRNLLAGLGIDVSQLPIDQLRDLANVFDSLSTLDQRAVASQLAGVANIREFSVLLESLEEGSRVQQVVDQGFSEGGEAVLEYQRRLESAAGQLQLLIGQGKEFQQALVEAGVLDFFGLAVQLAKPFLQTINDVLGAYGSLVGQVPGLRTVIAVTLQALAARALVDRARARQAAAAGAEAGAEGKVSAAKRVEKAATDALLAAERAMAAVRTASIASIEAETGAVVANTAAKRQAAGVPLPPPVAGRAAGRVVPVPPPPPGPTPLPPVPPPPRLGALPLPPRPAPSLGVGARIGGVFAGLGPALGITAAVVALQSFADAMGRVREATEGTNEAIEASVRAQVSLASSDLLAAVDILRNQAAEIDAQSGGITGSIANFFAGLQGESLDEQAARLRTEAVDLERQAREREQVERDRVQALNEGETVFGFNLDGVEELVIGMETLDAAGASAATKVEQIVAILERASSIQPGDSAQLSPNETADLAEGLGNALASLFAETVEQSLTEEGGRRLLGIADRETGKIPQAAIRESFGERFNTVEEIDQEIQRLTDQIISLGGAGGRRSLDPRVSAIQQEQERLRVLRGVLDDDELIATLESGVADIIDQVAGPDGILDTEQYDEVVRQAAALVEEQTGGAIDTTRFSDALRAYLESIQPSEVNILTEAEFDKAAELVAQNINAVRQVARLRGATPVEAIQTQIAAIDSIRRSGEAIGKELTEELELAYTQLVLDLAEAQNAQARAAAELAAARLPSADVAGRREIELGQLQQDLALARQQNDPAQVDQAEAAIIEYERETASLLREQLAAAQQAGLDLRDTQGRLAAEIEVATAALDSIAQFDSAGNQTLEYSQASEELASLLQEQAKLQVETAAAAARAEIDPADEVGNARADLDEANANLALQLDGTVEYYEAVREVAEARKALAKAEADLASAVARAGIDPRDDLRNAAQDVRDAEQALRLSAPGTREFFEAQRDLAEAILEQQRTVDAVESARVVASIDPRDTVNRARAEVADAQRAVARELPGSEDYYRAVDGLRGAQLALAEEERALAAAADLSALDVDDDVGRAEAELRAAAAELAAQIPGTIGYYQALEEFKQAQEAVADAANQVADARDLAGVRPGDDVGQAAAELRIARRALASARRGSAEYYEALREVAEAQRNLAAAQRELANARDIARLDPRDDLGRARADIRAAERALRDAVRGTTEYYEALAGLRQAQQALADALRARDDARDLASVFPGSEIQRATVDLRIAQRALAAAKGGTEEYYRALAQVKEAQVALARAQVEARGNQRLLSIDITNPIESAKAQLQNLLDLLNTLDRLGAPQDVLAAIQVQIREAQASLQSTVFSTQLSTLRDLVDIGAISEEQYIAYLESEKQRLLLIQDRTFQQNQQLIEIEKALQAANEGLQGQFNLGDIRTPTPFEVRKAIQDSVPGLTEIQDAFGDPTSSRNPLGHLVGGSIDAVNTLSDHVANFGDLVAAILGQVGLALGPGGILGKAPTGVTGAQLSGGGGGGSINSGGGVQIGPAQPLGIGGGSNWPTVIGAPSNVTVGPPTYWGTPGAIPSSSFASYDASSRVMTENNTYNIQVDGADFGKVEAMFERMLGSPATGSRSVSVGRKF